VVVLINPGSKVQSEFEWPRNQVAVESWSILNASRNPAMLVTSRVFTPTPALKCASVPSRRVGKVYSGSVCRRYGFPWPMGATKAEGGPTPSEVPLGNTSAANRQIGKKTSSAVRFRLPTMPTLEVVGPFRPTWSSKG
jgi:hypothetical protein